MTPEENKESESHPFVLKEYELLLELRREALAINQNRVTIFLGVVSART